MFGWPCSLLYHLSKELWIILVHDTMQHSCRWRKKEWDRCVRYVYEWCVGHDPDVGLPALRVMFVKLQDIGAIVVMAEGNAFRIPGSTARQMD